MKLYGIGNYDDWGCYFIVMAENEEEAWEKAFSEAVECDKNSGFNDSHFVQEEYNQFKTENKIEEITSGVIFGENC